MWKNNQKKLTAEKVKGLPVGTEVTLHGRDRHGYSTELMCEVVQEAGKRAKQLRYFDSSEMRVKRIPIRRLDGVVHFYTIERGEDEEDAE
ncbi:MAG: hypothetical protein IIZ51_01825 [Lachnospiraceae bacterium]|nr:hypothetical protein [Lachnospiraceae bacterium]